MANFTDFHRTFPLPDGTTARIVSLPAVARAHPRVARFPPSIRILLEAALRRADGTHAATEHAQALLDWRAGDGRDIPVWVSRVLLQDASGIPLLCDLAAMRSAAVRAGVHAQAVQPTLPVDLVVDHSVVVDAYGDAAAHDTNLAAEYRLNAERFQFVKWAARAFQGVRVIPPGNGIVHQINLEFLAGVVARRDGWLFPDTVVGTDSHTTMINALGVLGWGVGGLEAEIALLGEPLHQSAPEVVAVHLTGAPRGRVLATDVALHLTRALREAGVVGKFLEFVGPGARGLSLPDRATIANMAPEYGATTAFFGIDDTTLAYLAQTGRSRDAIDTIRAYYAAQGLFGIPDAADHDYTSVLSIDLSAVEPTLAGPARPHQTLAVAQLPASVARGGAAHSGAPDGLGDGAVVLAAITSCTNTANPAAMLAAGLLAKRAAARGLRPPGYVKTVLAPGSRAVTRYLERAGLLEPLQRLGFFVAAYGCASCVGNTGALADGVEAAVRARGLSVAAVLSGNRNFEGRIHRAIKANYLASPALVVAYALAGTVARDLDAAPLGVDAAGAPVFLADVWPDKADIDALVDAVVDERAYAGLYDDATGEGGDSTGWSRIDAPASPLFEWRDTSGYFVEPPFFDPPARDARPFGPVRRARVLAVLGDGVTTDHISPVGAIAADSEAARYLRARQVPDDAFNTYGARRCNHHVMMRGTFANPHLRNRVGGLDAGPVARSARDGATRSLFDVAMENREDGVPSVIVAGALYGSGSARDWAAKGTSLLGVAAVVAAGFERIHRSNLALMGVLPIEVGAPNALDALAWDGSECIDIDFDPHARAPRPPATVTVRRNGREVARVAGTLRIDTLAEWRYVREGGVLRAIFAGTMKRAR
ncbi:aconitate hydratase AcnA [Burkholderia stagnalis]|uniref:aconitate hydratase AcnA n=1 Tax=Burkholderia stagnalis TaxID=1503054 RepID=UPI00075380FB|nr:aconitate hydratase AcnA [Burkholderia stagnalis]KVM93998.1 aconitate hydratase [Burkholderia stagnalis]KWE01493.1 aconitate hydratase [Burkholderia stagnalis]KWE14076.1 aconitate hydratase [Burkholderia stagnalis]KWO76635.1 aconitate hydratase [Burkholderia stagnalis]